MGTPCLVGHNNLFSTSTAITASTVDASDTSFNVLHVIDERPYTFWRAGTAAETKYITIDTGQATSEANAFAVVGHNFSSAAGVIAIQHSSDNFVAITTAATYTATDNKSFGSIFSSAVNRYWRLAITQPATIKPYVGVLLLGNKLSFPRGERKTINPEAHTAINEGSNSKTIQPLGVINRGKQRRIQVDIPALESTWIRDEFVPVWDTHLSLSKPFIWHWNTAVSSACYTYEQKRKAFDRIPVWYVKLTLDLCGRVFGSAPCVAVGTGDKKCFNTFFTCKDSANYRQGTPKVYRFCSNGELPFNDGERPYIQSVTQLPTEIKKALPVLGRIKIMFYDEPDTDVGIDPYVTDRTSVQGKFWRKLLKRNPNYKGRSIQVYEGFVGIPESEFQLRFEGKIDNIRFANNGMVEVEGIDYIGDLNRVKIPYDYDIQIGFNVSSAGQTITLKGADVDVLNATTGSTYYLRAGSELISYQSSNYDSTSNQITGAGRGVAGTPAGVLAENEDISIAPYYEGNIFDIMHKMLVNPATHILEPGAGISTVYVNTTKFEAERDFSVGATEITVSGWVDETIKVSEAYFDLANLMDVKSWMGEDLKITVDRRIPNRPDRTYKKLTDDANIIINTDSFDQNEMSRFTRSYLSWSYDPLTDFDKGKNFARREAYIDLTLEGTAAYNESVLDVARTRFFRQGVMSEAGQNRFIQNRQRRWIQDRREAKPTIGVQLEYKDSDIKTGDFVRIGTDLFTDDLGNPVSTATCQVIKRNVVNSRVNLTLEKQRDTKTAFIGDSSGGAGSSAYTAASEAQANYAFIAAADSASSTGAVMDNGDPAYLIY
jgi:hypothetical protein